ncbi:RES domain-containing protein [Sphingopyxis fribergensis]
MPPSKIYLALRAPPVGLRPPSAARSARLTSQTPIISARGVLLRRRSGVPFERRLTDLDLFHFLHSADKAMSMPVLPSDPAQYMVTQLIADILRQSGFDGVQYASSVGPGHNFCVFSPGTLALVEGSESVHRVAKLSYALENVESRLDIEAGDYIRRT